jgi:flagellar basal-body rod modification protein FlgD
MQTSAITSHADSLNLLNTTQQARGGKTLGAEDFMKLLVTQLQTQDPLKPMEDTAFISQMASFTSLEQMRTLTTDFAAFQKTQSLAAANNYIGRQVTVTDAAQPAGMTTGVVSAVLVDGDGAPQLVINGSNYGLGAVKNFSVPAATPAPAPTNP